MLQIRSMALRRLCCLMLVLGLVGVAGSASGQTVFGCKEEADTCVVAKEETWTAVYGTLDLEDIADPYHADAALAATGTAKVLKVDEGSTIDFYIDTDDKDLYFQYHSSGWFISAEWDAESFGPHLTLEFDAKDIALMGFTPAPLDPGYDLGDPTAAPDIVTVRTFDWEGEAPIVSSNSAWGTECVMAAYQSPDDPCGDGRDCCEDEALWEYLDCVSGVNRWQDRLEFGFGVYLGVGMAWGPPPQLVSMEVFRSIREQADARRFLCEELADTFEDDCNERVGNFVSGCGTFKLRFRPETGSEFEDFEELHQIVTPPNPDPQPPNDGDDGEDFEELHQIVTPPNPQPIPPSDGDDGNDFEELHSAFAADSDAWVNGWIYLAEEIDEPAELKGLYCTVNSAEGCWGPWPEVGLDDSSCYEFVGGKSSESAAHIPLPTDPDRVPDEFTGTYWTIEKGVGQDTAPPPPPPSVDDEDDLRCRFIWATVFVDG